MTAYDILVTGLYYSFLPLTTTYHILLILFAPLLHVVGFFTEGLLIPLRILSRLESLYIFFSIAAFIGLITGILLHISSTTLQTLFNLQHSSSPGRTAASVRSARLAAREKKELEEVTAWQDNMTRRSEEARARMQHVMNGKGAEYSYDSGFGSGVGMVKGGRLGAQTILEEEDDSDEGF